MESRNFEKSMFPDMKSIPSKKTKEGSGRIIVLSAAVMTGMLICGGCGLNSEGTGQITEPNDSGKANDIEESNVLKEDQATGDFESVQWDMKELMERDFLLYNVNCGTGSPKDSIPGEPKGLYQSVTDQEYGEDAATGKSWGYIPTDWMEMEEDNLGEGYTASKWVIGREAEDSKAEICYDFQAPAGSYEVTVGFYNPFGVRKVDIACEGKEVVTDEKLLRYQLTEAAFEVQVQDGVLNLQVYNDEAKTFMDTPILSYIRIAVAPDYNVDLLRAAVDTMSIEGAEELYTEDSRKAFLKAFDEAVMLIDSGESADGGICGEKFKNLKGAYDMLVEKYRYDSFQPGEQWRDTENNVIQAHGGQVQQLPVKDEATGETVMKWVWVGEDKTAGSHGGIRAYSSDDLYNWQYEGIIMRNVPSRESLEEDEYFKNVYKGYDSEQLDNVYISINDTRAIIERPKLIYNEKTGQYVLWFHADGPTAEHDSSYAAACAGVAVSDSPFGPYRFIDRYRLNVCPEDQEDMYPQSRGMARDMNLFKDEDGSAYIIYSSEENLTLYISRLNEEYTYLAAKPEDAVYGRDYIRLFPGAQREAPAMFLRDGKYYLMTSGCTGWAPNQARYYVADSVLGEWASMGDPCVGDSNHTTFESQSTCIFQEPESGRWIYMGDRWFADRLHDSRYIWLPVSFGEKGEMEISFVREWKIKDGEESR